MDTRIKELETQLRAVLDANALCIGNTNLAIARIASLEKELAEANKVIETHISAIDCLEEERNELEAQLAAKDATIADLKELAYERAPKMAAEELQRQKEAFEKELAEANEIERLKH